MIKPCIPMPIQIVIDDVGWWCGTDGHEYNEPFRTGINRDHVPADYQAIVELGKQLNIRPRAAMVLCEWDSKNILKELPTSTWMGKHWDNSRWIGPWLEEAAQIIRGNRDHLELAIHGIGHEYWNNGRLTRAEWFDNQGNMKPKKQIEAHLDYYERLLNQHNLGPMPSSFCSCACLHCFGGDKENFASILIKRGIGCISTPFHLMKKKVEPQNGLFGFDAGVMTIDRGLDPIVWNAINSTPSEDVAGPILGIHWPNILHQDPQQNSEVIGRWCQFLNSENQKFDKVLAPNTNIFCQQLIHHQASSVRLEGRTLSIDARGYFKTANSNNAATVMIKVEMTPSRSY